MLSLDKEIQGLLYNGHVNDLLCNVLILIYPEGNRFFDECPSFPELEAQSRPQDDWRRLCLHLWFSAGFPKRNINDNATSSRIPLYIALCFRHPDCMLRISTLLMLYKAYITFATPNLL